VLELLEDSEASHVSSIQDDLIPYLVDLQFRSLEEQPPTIQRHVDTWLERRDTASMSSRPVGTMPPPSPNDLVRCYAMVRSLHTSYHSGVVGGATSFLKLALEPEMFHFEGSKRL
jgi:hypothetical protein